MEGDIKPQITDYSRSLTASEFVILDKADINGRVEIIAKTWTGMLILRISPGPIDKWIE